MIFISAAIVSVIIRNSKPELMMKIGINHGGLVIKVFVRHPSSSKILT